MHFVRFLIEDKLVVQLILLARLRRRDLSGPFSAGGGAGSAE